VRPPSPYLENEREHRRLENATCEQIAQREGDRLLKQHDLIGAEVGHRIAALIRIRRDEELEPF
jgi:hypothetical protein